MAPPGKHPGVSSREGGTWLAWSRAWQAGRMRRKGGEENSVWVDVDTCRPRVWLSWDTASVADVGRATVLTGYLAWAEVMRCVGTQGSRQPSGWHGEENVREVRAVTCPNSALSQIKVRVCSQWGKAELGPSWLQYFPPGSVDPLCLSLSLSFSHFGLCVHFKPRRVEKFGGLLSKCTPRFPASFPH